MTPIDRSVLDDAVAAVRAAGDLTLRWFGSADLDIEHKGDGTPVTQADKAAERLLREELGAMFPGDEIIGEEEASSAGHTGRTWIIDPIDGTKAFARGVPLYSNLLALYDQEGPAIGIINIPALDEIVYAGRGLGCYFNGEPTNVNETASLDRSCVCTSGMGSWTPAALDALDGAGPLLRTWGDGYGFTLVATGRVEAMVDPRVALWDMAPMPVILSEAGGRFSGLAGETDISLERDLVRSAVASNGRVHDELLRLLGGTFLDE